MTLITIATATAETSPWATYARDFTFTLTAERMGNSVRLLTEVYTYLKVSGTYQTESFRSHTVPDDIDDVCQAAERLEDEVRSFLEDELVYEVEFDRTWAEAAEEILYSAPAVTDAPSSAQRLRIWGELKRFVAEVQDREGLKEDADMYLLSDVLGGMAEDLHREADGDGGAVEAFDRRARAVWVHLDEMSELKNRIEHPEG